MIFVVEDDPTLLRMVSEYLAASGRDVERFASAEAALAAAREATPDLVLTDLQLGGMSGLELVRALGELDGTIRRIVMTAHGSIQNAVEAMRAGAFEFVEKPVDLARLSRLVDRALEERRARQELSRSRPTGEVLLGHSPAMEAVRRQLDALAAAPAPGPTVLIQGETGTGKGVVARLLHRARNGVDAPWLEVNCAALPASLVEAELFGHERSAFTDARTAKPGLFEAADGGTLFLDEVGELPLEVQAKLLKALESGRIRRVGSVRERAVKVSVIAASNVDLERAVREGRFRADLFHRLAAFILSLPPLRSRGDDVLELASAFLTELAPRYRKPLERLSPAAQEAVRQASWPGNVRELRFAIERAVLLAAADATELDGPVGDPNASRPSGMVTVEAAVGGVVVRLPAEGVPFDDLERAVLAEALSMSGGNVSQAARLLHLSRDTLRYRMKRHGLEGTG